MSDVTLELESTIGGKLQAHNFAAIYVEKQAAHLPGTREWAFAEVEKWLSKRDEPQLFWLMGGGGTGKTVLSAELLRRCFPRVVGWHFCRHDNKEQSEPVSLLRSLAAMLCHRLPGFEKSLPDKENPIYSSSEPDDVFESLFVEPLAKLPPPEETRFILIDALDEIPKEGQRPLLDVISRQFSKLPPWLRIFTTSRDEPIIKVFLSKFKPRELRADEEKNRRDVDMYLRHIARKHVKGDVNTEDIEAEVKRKYKIDMCGRLAQLQEPINRSREIYGAARESLRSMEGFNKLVKIPEVRKDIKQQVDDFNTLYKGAEQAQAKLTEIADEDWVENVDNPGIKGKERSMEKMKNDYAGDASRLKDLARLTFRFSNVLKILNGFEQLARKVSVINVKNKYASPTPIGYSDVNLNVEIRLNEDDVHVGEIQLNLEEMIAAKIEAHDYYKQIREELPSMCIGTEVDKDELEAFVVGKLNTSSLDLAVASLSVKANGLFLYAYLLEKHLESEEAAGREINFADLDSLPTGLADVYRVNFRRAFPKGTNDPSWKDALPLIQMIASAMEPLNVDMVHSVLEWDQPTRERVLGQTALLFPERDGLFHVFHKTVIDWMTGDNEDGALSDPSTDFHVELVHGHERLARAFELWMERDGPTNAEKTECGEYERKYFLRHGVQHLCRSNRLQRACHFFSSSLTLLRARVEDGVLDVVFKDYNEIKRTAECKSADMAPSVLQDVDQMVQYVGRCSENFRRDGVVSVNLTAAMQPDSHCAHKALVAEGVEPPITWCSKPQTADPISFRMKGKVFEALDRSPSGLVALLDVRQKALIVWCERSLETLAILEDKSLKHKRSRVRSMLAWSPDERFIAVWHDDEIVVAEFDKIHKNLFLKVRANRSFERKDLYGRALKPHFLWTNDSEHMVWVCYEYSYSGVPKATAYMMCVADGVIRRADASVLRKAVGSRAGECDEMLRPGGDWCLMQTGGCEGGLVPTLAEGPYVPLETQAFFPKGMDDRYKTWDCACFSPDGRSLALAQIGVCLLISVPNGKVFWRTDDQVHPNIYFSTIGFSEDSTMLIMGDATMLIMGDDSAILRVWDIEKPDSIPESAVPKHDSIPESAVIDDGSVQIGSQLAHLSGQHTIYVTDVSLGAKAATERAGVIRLSRPLLSLSKNEMLVWNAELASQSRGSVAGHDGFVQHTVWHQSGRWYATVCRNGELKFWSGRTGKLLAERFRKRAGRLEVYDGRLEVYDGRLEVYGDSLVARQKKFVITMSETVDGEEALSIQEQALEDLGIPPSVEKVCFGMDETTVFAWTDFGDKAKKPSDEMSLYRLKGDAYEKDDGFDRLLEEIGKGFDVEKGSYVSVWTGLPVVNRSQNEAYLTREKDRKVFTIDLTSMSVKTTVRLRGAETEPWQEPLYVDENSGSLLCSFKDEDEDDSYVYHFSLVPPSGEAVKITHGRDYWPATEPDACSISCDGRFVALPSDDRAEIFDLNKLADGPVAFFPLNKNAKQACFAPNDARKLVVTDLNGGVHLLRVNVK